MDPGGHPLDPHLLGPPAVAPVRGVQAPLTGRPRFYSYDNLGTPPEDSRCSCGHAAIASLLDFHDRVPLPPALRTVRGEALADDGRLHFPNELLVRQLFAAHPPVSLPGVRFVTREIIQQAMRQAGLRVGEAWPPLLGSDASRFATARQSLCEWISRTGLPAVTLVDMKPLFGSGDLHWGLIHAFDNQGVWMASWHQVSHHPWERFAAAWHCQGWIYPNNFYALFVTP